jgi:hypothetical protein
MMSVNAQDSQKIDWERLEERLHPYWVSDAQKVLTVKECRDLLAEIKKLEEEVSFWKEMALKTKAP